MTSSARKTPEPSAPAPFLGVARSFAGRAWTLRHADERLAETIAQRHPVGSFLARLLAARQVLPEAVEAYLSPTLRDTLPDPSDFADMDKAAARLADAVESGEAIAVFGDYDVDGATSSALLERYLAALGARPRIYIPDRLSEGYGPNAAALRMLAQEGARLVITVDCGTAAHEALAAGVAAGLDIVVVDHHKASPDLPAVHALVNPNRLDCSSGHGQLAAVGVAFMLAVATNRELRRRGYFAGDGAEPALVDWLDLVALGTVCDVVPLTGVNRAFVAQGLKVMARGRNAGLAALGRVAGLAGAPAAYHAGFLLGPRVNAGGRVGASGLGVKLLATEDADEAERIARRLDLLNEERRAIEAEVLEDALARVARDGLGESPVAVVAGAGWHPGVIGIVAARVKERTGKPAVVIALDEAGAGKGSGRSIAGVDLGAAVLRAREAGLVRDGGGHPMAAGLTVAPGGVPALAAFLCADLAGAVGCARSADTLTLDGAIACGGATGDLVDDIARAGPYGAGNPEPRLAICDATLRHADIVGNGHVRMSLAGTSGRTLKAIAFRSADTELGARLLSRPACRLHLAGRLKRDGWRGGEAVEMHVEDAAEAT